jgi:peptidoglycan/xylan/chitin deacetylase (PgdA/CDA1 family)
MKLRLDTSELFSTVERRISTFLIKPLVLARHSVGTILAYHDIGPESSARQMPPDFITIEAFEKQMQVLHNQDVDVIPLQKLCTLLILGEKLPRRTAVITFDDGYKSTFSYALPILQFYHFPATVFLAVDYIGYRQSFPWLKEFSRVGEFPSSPPLDWDDVKALHKAGIEIGSHSCSHKFLPRLNPDDLYKEITRSHISIKEKVGEPPRAFALPFSFPVRHPDWPHFYPSLLTGLEVAGYSACCTSYRGNISVKSNPLLLERIFINKYDTNGSFAAKLCGAYAWTRLPQYIYQKYWKNYTGLDTSLTFNHKVNHTLS